MPQVIPVVAYLATVYFKMGVLTSALTMIAAVWVAGELSDDEKRAHTTHPGLGMKANTRSTREYYKIIYGIMRVGGNEVFVETTGTDKKDLWIVMNIGEGECDSVVDVFINTKNISFYNDTAEYWFHGGSASQTHDINIYNATNGRYNDANRNTCYIVFHFKHDPEYFSSYPKKEVLLKGRKLYDFRTGVTAWSDNPVLAMYDYMTNTRYGMGKSAALFDIPSWTDAANYCELKGFTINCAINQNNTIKQHLDDFCRLFRGSLGWMGGKFVLRYSDINYESTVMNITDKHILRETTGEASLILSQPGKFGTYDALRASYVDPVKDYATDAIIVGDELGVVGDTNIMYSTDKAHIGEITTYLLERNKLDRSISGVFRDDCNRLEPHDLVNFSCAAFNIEDQLLRVVMNRIQPNGLASLSFMYENEDLYNLVYDSNIETVYTCDLPDKDAPPPPVENVVLSEEQYDYRLRTFTKLKVSFNPPSKYPWYSHVEVWHSFDDVDYKFLYPVNNDFEIDPVREGVPYYIRLKTVSIYNQKTSDAHDYKVSTIVNGYVGAPSSLTSLERIVNANAINLYSYKVADPDVELYEFRLGESWAGSLFLGAFRSPNLSLNGVRPGTHTFFCNTLSNNGVYGASPVSASAVLSEPPDGWSIISTSTDNYAAGTHDNTEQIIYDGESYLKCSHAGGVLKGTYTSPVFDKTSSARYMCYLMAAVVVTGTGTDWNSVIPLTNHAIEGLSNESPCVVTWVDHGMVSGDLVSFSGITQANWSTLNNQHFTITKISNNSFSIAFDSFSFAAYVPGTDPGLIHKGTTWGDMGIDVHRWRDIFELEQAPTLTIDLYYGDTSPPTNIVTRLEILSAIVSARYYQIKITITDPTPEIYAYVQNNILKFCQ